MSMFLKCIFLKYLIYGKVKNVKKRFTEREHFLKFSEMDQKLIKNNKHQPAGDIVDQ